jgi:hypothetical protein
MYHRLGLNQLAQEEQQKLGAGNKIGQSVLDNKHYTVDYDANGGIKRAWNSEGQRVDDNTLAALSAGGAKAGKEIYQQSGQRLDVLDKNGNLVGKVQQTYNKELDQHKLQYVADMGGHKAGELYNGEHGTLQPERVAAAEAINTNRINEQNASTKDIIQNRANSQVQNAGKIGFNRAAGSAAGRESVLNQTNIPYPQQGVNNSATTNNAPVTAPQAQPQPGAQPAQANPNIKVVQPPRQTAQAPQENVPGTPPPYNPQLSPIQNKEIQKNWGSEQKKILTDFAPGGSAGKQIVAITTATNHINDDFKPLIDKLNNGQYPSVNELKNKLSTWSGGTDVTNINLIGHAMADEISKTLTQGGPGALADRQAMEAKFNSAQNPQQLKEAVKYAERLMAGKTETLEAQYKRSGRNDFYTNVVPDPRVKNVVDQIRAERNVNSGQTPQGTTSTGVKFKVITQ